MARINVDHETALAELHDARRDLLKVLETLGPGDWDKPTLCEGWKVRHVVGHLAHAPDTKLRNSVVGLVKARGDRESMTDGVACKLAMRPVEEILDHYRRNVANPTLPPTVSAEQLLAEVVIHSLDICQPNGWELELPADRIRMVLSTLVQLGRPLRGKERAEGLHFDTTDIDWRCGCGEHVRGPSRSMLLALAGRTSACDQLHGDGVGELASRH